MKKNENNKENSWNWLFWWQIDKAELSKQVDEYDDLSVTKSARGISFLCLVLSIIVTFIFILLDIIEVSALFDILLFLVLAVFVYIGKKWAMIGAMIVWTYEKLFFLFDSSIEANLFVSILWWATYMHAFWLAFKVEQVRSKLKKNKKLKKENLLKDDLLNLEKLSELKEKGVITDDEFSRKKKEILGL
jgi:uncharacterized membrane protein